MNTHHDIMEFPDGQEIRVPSGLPSLPRGVVSVYGWILVNLEGHDIWKAATATDFHKALTRLGLPTHQIDAMITAKETSGLDCYLKDGGCTGSGCVKRSCVGRFDSSGNIAYCYCAI